MVGASSGERASAVYRDRQLDKTDKQSEKKKRAKSRHQSEPATEDEERHMKAVDELRLRARETGKKESK
jgi:hypothetical protein